RPDHEGDESARDLRRGWALAAREQLAGAHRSVDLVGAAMTEGRASARRARAALTEARPSGTIGRREPGTGQNADLRRAGPSPCVQLECAYPEAIARAGGVPLILPMVTGADLDRVLGQIDGLMLVGGDDYDPGLYGESPHPTVDVMPAARQS